MIGLTTERKDLYRRIDERVERMLQQGLIEEVKGLLQRGYSPESPSMSGVGYQQIVQYLNGEMRLEEAAQRIKFETHRFARQQYAWFHPADESIRWFDVRDDIYDGVIELIRGFTSRQPRSGRQKQLSGKGS